MNESDQTKQILKEAWEAAKAREAQEVNQQEVVPEQPKLSNERLNSSTEQSKAINPIDSPNSIYRILSYVFFILALVIGVKGCAYAQTDARIVGGDAYNYIIGAGQGTAIVCVAIIFALVGVIFAIFDLAEKIKFNDKFKS